MGIYVWGTGCGASELIEAGLEPERITAFVDSFPMGDTFLGKPVLLPDQLPLHDCDLLIIDDLGTEPMLQNITIEQLFNLLNERQMAGRHTVISTNLAMSELQERYTERVTSRLLDATGCRRLLFIGADIRRSLKRKEGKA